MGVSHPQTRGFCPSSVFSQFVPPVLVIFTAGIIHLIPLPSRWFIFYCSCEWWCLWVGLFSWLLSQYFVVGRWRDCWVMLLTCILKLPLLSLSLLGLEGRSQVIGIGWLSWLGTKETADTQTRTFVLKSWDRAGHAPWGRYTANSYRDSVFIVRLWLEGHLIQTAGQGAGLATPSRRILQRDQARAVNFPEEDAVIDSFCSLSCRSVICNICNICSSWAPPGEDFAIPLGLRHWGQ